MVESTCGGTGSEAEQRRSRNTSPVEGGSPCDEGHTMENQTERDVSTGEGHAMNDYISREAVEQFIENGLNNPDKSKAFGHDAVEILTEVHFMDAADVRPVVCCRDCIYDDNCFAQSIFKEMSRIPFDKNKFFCPDGKRREGGAAEDGCITRKQP